MTMLSTDDPETRPAVLADDSLSPWQWVAVGVCVALQVLDGFDIFVMSTAATRIQAELALSTPELGEVLSASLVGMMMGALLIAGLADKWGRRPIILLCLAIDTIGMVCAGFAHDGNQLMAFRFLTGLGVGGIMPVINTACAELSGAKRRNLIITIQATGYPLGGLAAALLGAVWLGAHSWRTLMELACVPAVVVMVLVIVFLPESIPFLLARRPANALVKINRILRRYGRAKLDVLPPDQPKERREGWHLLFKGEDFQRLWLFSVVTFLTQFSFYFFVSWLPAVIEPRLAGIPLKSIGSVTLNLGGVLGDIAFGAFCLWITARNLTLVAMLLAVASVWLLSLSMGQPLVTVGLAVLIGGSLFAAMAGIYSTAPAVFPPLTRSAGTGIAFSLGRFGGALSPWLGALALNKPELGLSAALLAMAAPLLLAAILLKVLASAIASGQQAPVGRQF